MQNDPVNFVDPTGLLIGLTCFVDGVQQPYCSAALGLVRSGAGVIYGGTGWYGDGEIFVVDYLHMNDRQLTTWQSIFLNPAGSMLPQDRVLGGPRVKKCDSVEVKAELNSVRQDALSAADLAESEAREKFESSISPGKAALEGGLTTLLYAALTRAPLTVAGAAGSGGAGLAVHVLVGVAVDSHNWEKERSRVRGQAYSKIMNYGIKQIEQKYGVALPHARLWPGMSPCK